jgi:phosphoribosylanthranilate isomerase
MTPRVKVCGNTRLEDAMTALDCGADALGFIFYAPSPRAADPAIAAGIVRQLPAFVTTVGVFVNETVERMNAIAETCRLDRIQLHGQEPYELLARLVRPAYRARKLRGVEDLEALLSEPDRTVLLDTFDTGLHGGTGRTFDWSWAREAARHKRVILAGGLNAGNVARAVQAARPYAVDVSSALEASPGIKDPHKIEAFFRALHGVSSGLSPSSHVHASAN